MSNSLTDKQIDLTYQSLIKIIDNLPLTDQLKSLSDGEGNALPIKVSNSTLEFTGDVIGLPTPNPGYKIYTAL
jgi:hypothetical protein